VDEEKRALRREINGRSKGKKKQLEMAMAAPEPEWY
jgi:hypothetical protein